MSPVEIERQLRSFLVSAFAYRGAIADLASDAPLLEQGILDSTAVLEIVSFLEQQLGIEVGDDEVVPQNFGSIARIVAYVRRSRER